MLRSSAAARRGLLLGAAILAATSAATAQETPSPGQLAPRTLAPEIVRRPTGVTLPEMAGTNAPAGAERIPLRVRDVAVEGGDPALAAETAAITARLRGRPGTTVADAYAAAAALEAAYAARGAFLTRVVIPPQDVRPGGTLRLRVVEGFVERVDASQLSPRVRGRVEAVTEDLVGARRLTLGTFERRLLLAGDTPGLTLRSTVRPGTETGGVVLVLEGEHRPLAAEFFADNTLPRTLGRWSAGGTVSLLSAFGQGEQLYATVSGSPGHRFLEEGSQRRLFAGGAVVPIGRDGFAFNAEATYSDTRPLVGPGTLQTESTLERYAFRLLYPLVRGRTTNVVVRTTLDVVNEEQRAPDFGVVLYDDRVRPLRLGVDVTHLYAPTGATVAFGAEFTQGVGWLGSRGRAEATAERPLSRQGADDVFSKFELRGRIAQPLFWNTVLELSGRAQVALTGPLVNAERFTLGGPRALSALDAGLLSGDHGYLVRAELQVPFALPSGPLGEGVVVPYLFAARGEAFNRRPTVIERRVVQAADLGVGARATLIPVGLPAGPRAVDLGLEAAREVTDDPAQNGWRLNANINVRF